MANVCPACGQPIRKPRPKNADMAVLDFYRGHHRRFGRPPSHDLLVTAVQLTPRQVENALRRLRVDGYLFNPKSGPRSVPVPRAKWPWGDACSDAVYDDRRIVWSYE